MITLHWFQLYCIVAWTWAATCWAYEAAEGKHRMSTLDSIGAALSAPLYFPLVLLVIGGEVVIEVLHRWKGRV